MKLKSVVLGMLLTALAASMPVAADAGTKLYTEYNYHGMFANLGPGWNGIDPNWDNTASSIQNQTGYIGSFWEYYQWQGGCISTPAWANDADLRPGFDNKISSFAITTSVQC